MIKKYNSGRVIPVRIKTISPAVPSSILGNIRGARKAVIAHQTYNMTAPNTHSPIGKYISFSFLNSALASLTGNYSN
jgi:hypothetical protein